MLPFRCPDKPYETAPNVIDELPESNWLSQAKYDGWRMSVYVDGPGHVRCLTRSGNDMSKEARAKFDPAIKDQLVSLGLPEGTVLDCEFVGPRGGHKPAVYIFDMLAWAGQWLVNEPYKTRWARCCELKMSGLLNLAETVYSNFLELFDRLKADWIATGSGMHLCEGIVAKRLDGTMKLDRRSSKKSGSMMKLKYRDILDKRY